MSGPLSFMKNAQQAVKSTHGMYTRFPLRFRQVAADLMFAASAVLCAAAVFMPSAIEGVPLRRAALLGELAILFLNWVVWRRMPARASRIMRNGLFAAGVGVALLCMTFHQAGGINTLAGFVSLLAMYAARHSYDDPEVAAEFALREAAKPAQRPPLSYLFENIENIAVSLVVIVLIWHFCLEAFRIPSGSMQPTLYGDPVWGDRVLVDKVVYEFRDPIRWEPTVFRFPLKRTDPYVKRVIGLPGEQLLIAQGDVFCRQTPSDVIKLLQKTPSARATLWFNYVGEVGDKAEFLKYFAREGDVDFEQGAIRLTQGGAAIFPKGEGGKAGDVRDHDPDGNGGYSELGYNVRIVGDLRVKLKVESLKQDLNIGIESNADTYTLTLSADKKRCALRHLRNGQQGDVDAARWPALEAAEGDEFTFSVADGYLEVQRGGLTVLSAEVGTALLDALRTHDKARKDAGRELEPLNSETITGLAQGRIETERRGRITLRSGDAKVRLLSVDRDIYYVGRVLDVETSDKPQQRELPYGFVLGDDEYFCMGDNSPNSLDCRFWVAIDIVMADGTVHTGALDDAAQVITPLLEMESSGEPVTYRQPDGRFNRMTCRRSLHRIARFSQKERGQNLPNDAAILKASLEGLKRIAQDRQLSRLQFTTEGGGVEYLTVSDIKALRVRSVSSVKRPLFVGKPFAVFLWPHRMKLIE